MSKLLTALLLFVISMPAWAGSDLSIQKLELGLAQVQSLKQLPKMTAAPDDEIDRASYPVPSHLREDFNRLQNFIYGRTNLIQLKTCNHCRAASDANRMTVYLDLEFFKTLTETEATFVLAHELSHFSLDYMTLLSLDGLTPNGNIPLLRKVFSDYVNIAAYIKMDETSQQAELAHYFNLATAAHAEVDLLAILIVQKMGRNVVPDAKKLLLSFVNTSTDLAKEDANFRFGSLNRIFPND